MKKIIKMLACLAICLSFTGCFSKVYTRTGSNQLDNCQTCKEVEDITNLVDNIMIMNKSVNSVNGNYTLVNSKDTYNLSFVAITKEKRAEWDLSAKTVIDNKEIKIYAKDGKFYVVYPNNGANIILKDTMENLLKEAKETLEILEAKYNKENLENLILGDKFAGINFEEIKKSGEYVKNNDGTYTITYIENGATWTYQVSSNYLIEVIKCSDVSFNSTLNLEYPKETSIVYPNGLDFFTVNIQNVKKLLEVESFAQVIDPSLKK